MERFRVAGGARLSGKVTVAGAKNSALKLMASALLAPGETIITNLPAIADVDYMAELLTRLGCKVKIDKVKVQRPVLFELAHDINELFPHIYGALNLDSVVSVETIS